MAATNYVSGPLQPFNIQIVTLQEDASKIFDSYILANQRRWMVPSPYLGWNFDIHNLSGPDSITAAFDRDSSNPDGGDSINTSYVKALRNGAQKDDALAGKVAEIKCAKYQNDELACMERAYRTRVASPIRCAMHSAARRAGHSFSEGVVHRKLAMCSNMIIAAQVDNLPNQSTATSTHHEVADNSTDNNFPV